MQTWIHGEYGHTVNPPLVHHRTENKCVLLLNTVYFSVFFFPHTQTQASSIENKQDWIKHIREVIQERTVHLKGALKEPIHIPKPSTAKHKGRRYTPRPVKHLYSYFNILTYFL